MKSKRTALALMTLIIIVFTMDATTSPNPLSTGYLIYGDRWWLLTEHGILKLTILLLYLILPKYIGNGDLQSLQHLISDFCVCAMKTSLAYGEDELQIFDAFVRKESDEERLISVYACIAEKCASKEDELKLFLGLTSSILRFNSSNLYESG